MSNAHKGIKKRRHGVRAPRDAHKVSRLCEGGCGAFVKSAWTEAGDRYVGGRWTLGRAHYCGACWRVQRDAKRAQKQLERDPSSTG